MYNCIMPIITLYRNGSYQYTEHTSIFYKLFRAAVKIAYHYIHTYISGIRSNIFFDVIFGCRAKIVNTAKHTPTSK